VSAAHRRKIVVLGMMSKMPVPGNIWLVAQYLIGFQRLGFDVYYVEAHGMTPFRLMERKDDDGALLASEFISGVMRRFDLSDRWAFHSRFEDRYFGLSATGLRDLYQSADLLINLHGSTVPLPEHSATGRLIYLETDPVQLQIELHNNDEAAVKFLEPHVAFFSWGLNYGYADCLVPLDSRFPFRPTLPPVLLDFWPPQADGAGPFFTTIGNWRQAGAVRYEGETYYWSKDREFRKFLDLPSRVGAQFELALSSGSHNDEELALLTGKGWRVRDALAFSSDLDEYRRYIGGSRGEFTVAKDQNVRLRSGWFSERSATYLAAGRPVVTQDTGFGNALPTGEGLFAFSTVEEAAGAIQAINADYERHRRAAAGIARDCFSHDVVLKRLLDDLGLAVSGAGGRQSREALPLDLVIVPTSRWPTTLPASTVDFTLASQIPVPPNRAGDASTGGFASIVIVSHDNLVFTKLCLASVLSNTGSPDHEVIVVDNGSTDGTPGYLRELASRHPNVRVAFNDDNRGFAPANNQGVGMATGSVLVLLNNDTIVPRGWLARLTNHLGDPAIGLVGPVTNRAGNEAEIEAPYRTYGELLDFARDRANERDGQVFDIRVATMFCVAMRREIWERLGSLDERFEVGLFEDDDYAMRARQAGYRIVCAEDTFVHHFGQASIGKLGPTRDYGNLFHQNRRRWEEKWGTPWQPYSRRRTERYQDMTDRIQAIVRDTLPLDETVLVVSRGDDELLKLDGRTAWHFPRTEGGVYSGCHPADGAAAIRALEAQREKGAGFLVLPSTASWWLDHYAELRQHLERLYLLLVREEDTCMIFDLRVRPHRANGAASDGQWGGVEDAVR
jgi:GT2 family glycosyltransferase